MARQYHWHRRRYDVIILRVAVLVLLLQKQCLSASEPASIATRRRVERINIRHDADSTNAIIGSRTAKFQTTAYIPPLSNKLPSKDIILSSITSWLTGSSGIIPKEKLVGEALGSVTSKALDRSSSPSFQKKNEGVLATEAMQFCYRACFASASADLFSAIMNVHQFSIRQKIWPSWSEVVDVLSSLNLLSMAFGLRKVHRFLKDIVASEKDLTNVQLIQTSSVMAKVWRNMALMLFLVSTTLATTLGQGGIISSKWIICGVTSVTFLGGMVIQYMNSKKVAQLLKDEDISYKSNTTCIEGAVDTVTIDDDQSKARSICFTQSHNMALCIGSFMLTSTMRFLHWLLPHSQTSPVNTVEKFFSIDDFLTPFTLALFLKSLYHNYLRVVVAATSGLHNFNSSMVDDEIYNAFFKAQISFYGNVGDTLSSAIAFSLMPYLFGFLNKVKRLVWV